MATKSFYGADARQRILGGAEILYRGVKTTLGVKGGNALIERKFGSPLVTHDGVTVLRAIEIPVIDDETLGYSVGAEFLKEAGNNMDKVGDGTSTVTVLMYHTIKEANKLIASDHNTQEVAEGITLAANEAVKLLDKYSEAVDGKDKITNIATISAGSSEIGELISDVIAKIGHDGAVSVEASNSLELESEITEGFTIDRGFISPYLVTDQARQEAIYKDVLILIMDRKISNVMELIPLLEEISKSGKKDLFIIAEDVEADPLAMFIMNKIKGTFNVIAIKSPSFGDRQQDVLDDIATLTGATVVGEARSVSITDGSMAVLGQAKQIIVGKDETTIINGKGAKEDLAIRIGQINGEIKLAKNDFELSQLQKRRADLNGKVAVIKVGGTTETEINHKKDRVDDAVAAAKAALKEGIVAGGGVTLLNISKEMTVKHDNPSIQAGIEVFKKALTQPFMIILKNAGLNPSEWSPQVTKGIGVDVRTGELVDMKKAGIIDPTLVTRKAIENASSIASNAITMGVLVAQLPETNKGEQL